MGQSVTEKIAQAHLAEGPKRPLRGGRLRFHLSEARDEEKFAALAEGVLSRAAQKKVREAVWNLEKLERVSGLMKLMKARGARATEPATAKGNA